MENRKIDYSFILQAIVSYVVWAQDFFLNIEKKIFLYD